MRIKILVAVLVVLTGCDSSTEQTVAESQPAYESYYTNTMATSSPLFPTESFVPGNARLTGDAGVAVVDGRLHFEDVDAYVAFLEEVSTWTAEDRSQWEQESGFFSLVSHVDTLKANGSSARLSDPPLYVEDENISTVLSPTGEIGIGNRVFDLSIDRLTVRDEIGLPVGETPVILPLPDCDNIQIVYLGCDDDGGPGGPPSGPGADNPYVLVRYGREIATQDTRILQQYEMLGEADRFWIFIYSSLYGKVSNYVVRYRAGVDYFGEDHAPDSGNMFCRAQFSDRRDETQTFIWTGPGQSRASVTEHTMYFDQDVFDFTGAGSIQRIDCNASLTSQVYEPNQPPSFRGSGSLSVSKNF